MRILVVEDDHDLANVIARAVFARRDSPLMSPSTVKMRWQKRPRTLRATGNRRHLSRRVVG